MSSTERVGQALCRVLGRLRDLHIDMTVQQALVFMYVAGHPGTTQAAIMRDLGLGDSLVSRAIGLLTDIGLRRVRGLELVDQARLPDDRRTCVLTLTPKGRRLMDDIRRDLNLESEKPWPLDREEEAFKPT